MNTERQIACQKVLISHCLNLSKEVAENCQEVVTIKRHSSPTPPQVFFVFTPTCIITPLFTSLLVTLQLNMLPFITIYCNTHVASRFTFTLCHLVRLYPRDCVREFLEEFLHSFTSKLKSSPSTYFSVPTRAIHPYLCAMMLLQQSHLLSSLRLLVRFYIYFFNSPGCTKWRR